VRLLDDHALLDGRHRVRRAPPLAQPDGHGAERAELIACWGRRRWNVENGFHAEKHGGFGLEHTFCNDETASLNLHAWKYIRVDEGKMV